ncbi:ribosome hibernation-promoting factor, HPF/YfiA family [Oceanisphaera sp. W20_SRM_FM3]|uniref:ribosome hibernation-promoting factor, HPF/YfiA family n=1 Tax=Oceanisphaera sp. W20_SRM_FM3 TaxID=3240267 RepID=UPI003F98DCFB
MSITITSTVIDISPAIRERIESRFEKLSRRQVDLIAPHVIINKEGLKYQVEATAGVRHDTLFAKAEDDNLYAAIKDLGQKLERQLNRYADKPLAQRAVAAGAVAAVLAGELGNESDDEFDEEFDHEFDEEE